MYVKNINNLQNEWPDFRTKVENVKTATMLPYTKIDLGSRKNSQFES